MKTQAKTNSSVLHWKAAKMGHNNCKNNNNEQKPLHGHGQISLHSCCIFIITIVEIYIKPLNISLTLKKNGICRKYTHSGASADYHFVVQLLCKQLFAA